MMTDEDVLAELQSDSRLNRMRAVFASECGRIDQASSQRRPPTPIEIKRMEFDAVQKIIDVFES